MRTISSTRIPADIIEYAARLVKEFHHCKIKPDVEVTTRVAASGVLWEVESVVCNLDSPYNRGVISIRSHCDACKVKAETGKYPGEDFHPLDHIQAG